MTLNLSILKKHLNIPADYAEDDEYLVHLGAVAEAYAATLLELDGTDAATVARREEILEKPQVKEGLLLLVGTLYNNRESEVYANTQETKAFRRLIYQYKPWSV
ncbi:head-tail connector protein [Prevotella sp. KH2C16]|uniref:head-tail connector protein n=1 Tax=Prevotella sp. KH2C16 TaxID=1855325 RepID=UPI0008E5246D|nr:head-tail connector protein [Prevotella sp. KH2C16]SFF96549.1 Phage gp6-like head-tail connector protein [Prevotella sp. KH2C16]